MNDRAEPLAMTKAAQTARETSQEETVEAQRKRIDALENLVTSDLDFIRVLEDLIHILLERNVIMLTDLPEAARTKVMGRRELRGDMLGIANLVGEDDFLL